MARVLTNNVHLEEGHSRITIAALNGVGTTPGYHVAFVRTIVDTVVVQPGRENGAPTDVSGLPKEWVERSARSRRRSTVKCPARMECWEARA